MQTRISRVQLQAVAATLIRGPLAESFCFAIARLRMANRAPLMCWDEFDERIRYGLTYEDMQMSRISRPHLWAGAAVLFSVCWVSVFADEIPLNLSKPDGKAGDPGKPVKVYILAGQSNMVGMGDLSGARPPFPSQYLTVDSAVIPGATPIGLNSGGKPIAWLPVARHGVFEAKASIYDGPADASNQLRKTIPVALGTVSENLPVVGDGQRLVVTAQMDVPNSGTYTVRAGYGDSSYNTVLLDGKEVYRRQPGAAAVMAKVSLEAGKRYPISISYLKGGSAAFWLEQVDIEGKGDLNYLTAKEGKFAYLIDGAGNWSARQDVTYTDPRLFPTRPASPLSATSNNGK